MVQTLDGTFISRRYLVCELFLRIKDKDGERKFKLRLENVKNFTNNPLHWAIYRSDQQLALLLFRINPLLLFMLNDKNELPLDLCFMHEEKLNSNTSVKIIKRLVGKVYDILKQTGTLQGLGSYFANDPISRIQSMPDAIFKTPERMKSGKLSASLTHFIAELKELGEEEILNQEMPNDNPGSEKNNTGLQPKKGELDRLRHFKLNSPKFAKIVEDQNVQDIIEEEIESVKKYANIEVKILHHKKNKFYPKNYKKLEITNGEEIDPVCQAFLVQRVMAFLVIEDKLEEYIEILQMFDIAPFAPVVLGKFNILHLAVVFSSSRFIKNFVNIKFFHMDKRGKERILINWEEVANIQTNSRLDNVLHMACRYNRIPVYNLFKSLGCSLTSINIRGWKPLELAPGTSKFFINEEHNQKRELFVRLRNECIEEQKKLSQLKSDSKKEKKQFNAAMKRIEELRLDSYDINYDYCIFANCDSNNVTKSTLYKLLESINTKAEDLLRNYLEGVSPEEKKSHVFQDHNLKLTKRGFKLSAEKNLANLLQKKSGKSNHKIIEFKVLRGALNPPQMMTKEQMEKKKGNISSGENQALEKATVFAKPPLPKKNKSLNKATENTNEVTPIKKSFNHNLEKIEEKNHENDTIFQRNESFKRLRNKAKKGQSELSNKKSLTPEPQPNQGPDEAEIPNETTEVFSIKTIKGPDLKSVSQLSRQISKNAIESNSEVNVNEPQLQNNLTKIDVNQELIHNSAQIQMEIKEDPREGVASDDQNSMDINEQNIDNIKIDESEEVELMKKLIEEENEFQEEIKQKEEVEKVLERVATEKKNKNGILGKKVKGIEPDTDREDGEPDNQKKIDNDNYNVDKGKTKGDLSPNRDSKNLKENQIDEKTALNKKGGSFKKFLGFFNYGANENQDLVCFSSHKGSDAQAGEYVIFMVKLTEEYKAYLADFLEYKAYLKNSPFHVSYKKNDASKYERFKTIDSINLLQHLLEQEMDIQKFEKEGFVIDHFPLHHYRQKKEVFINWKKHVMSLFWSNLFGNEDNRNYKGLIAFNFYHGRSIGYFMGFILVYSSWLLFLAVPQLIFYIIAKLWLSSYQEYYQYSAGINVLWSFFFIANFQKRQKLFKKLFESSVQKNEVKSVSQKYKGDYVIDKKTNQVTKFDKFTPFKRRIFVRL